MGTQARVRTVTSNGLPLGARRSICQGSTRVQTGPPFAPGTVSPEDRLPVPTSVYHRRTGGSWSGDEAISPSMSSSRRQSSESSALRATTIRARWT
jgi:hypothetical protein